MVAEKNIGLGSRGKFLWEGKLVSLWPRTIAERAGWRSKARNRGENGLHFQRPTGFAARCFADIFGDNQDNKKSGWLPAFVGRIIEFVFLRTGTKIILYRSSRLRSSAFDFTTV